MIYYPKIEDLDSSLWVDLGLRLEEIRLCCVAGPTVSQGQGGHLGNGLGTILGGIPAVQSLRVQVPVQHGLWCSISGIINTVVYQNHLFCRLPIISI